jgi:hypothetical protein
LAHPGLELLGDQLGCFVVVERDDGDQPFAAGAGQRAGDFGCKETHLSALPPLLFAGAAQRGGCPLLRTGLVVPAQRPAQRREQQRRQATTSDPGARQAASGVGT